MASRSNRKEETTPPPSSLGSKHPTAPPPPDASSASRTKALSSTIPPSFTTLDDEFVMPEAVFFERLEERARRVEMLTALLQAKGLPPGRGVRALQAALGAIVTSAEEAHLPSLGSLARALEAAIGELGVPREGGAQARTLDVLVLDETEVSRDLVALAVEAEGHIVRCADSYDDFVRQLDERLPDLIVTEVELSNVPARHFCSGLRDLLANRPVPLVFFSSVVPDLLERLATTSRARAAVSKDRGIEALLVELDRVLPTI